ncbi:RHS repeat-associated core domain-containing protein, partial [Cyclobacterium xiamenense]
TVTASMEPARSSQETNNFEGVHQTRQSGVEHNSTPGGSHSAWLNAGRGRILGPARRQEVAIGEQVLLSVRGKYRDRRGLSVKPETFIASGAKTQLLDRLTEFRNAPAAAGNPVLWLSLADLLIQSLQRKPVPEAYLLYALYDSEGKLYRQGKRALSKKAAGKHEFLEVNFYIEQDGYMEAFLVNETETDVWFDDFRVQTLSPLVVQEDHYDPWGLALSGLEYRMEDRQESRYGFNGKDLISDAKLNLYDFGARLYDPSVARWSTVDPLADHQKQLDKSPYAAMWNNPITYNDPDGRCPECEEEVKNPSEGQVYQSRGGAEYTFGNGQWTRDGGMLDGVNVEASRLENNALDQVNLALTIGGGIYGGFEGLATSQGLWLGKNEKYYSVKWGGNQYTGSRAGALQAARSYRLAGKATLIGSLGVGFYLTLKAYQVDGEEFGYNTQRAAAGSAGSILGGLAGAKAGVLIGGAAGSFFGGAGAIPGAVIGGVIGGFGLGMGGSYLGEFASEAAIDQLHKAKYW